MSNLLFIVKLPFTTLSAKFIQSRSFKEVFGAVQLVCV